MESIFGIGGPELLLILVLATIVLGPLRMIRVARQLGILLRDLRNYYQQLTSGLSDELAALDDLGKVDLNLDSLTAPLSDPARSITSSQEPTAPAAQPQSFALNQAATAPAEQSRSIALYETSTAPAEPAESSPVQAGGNGEGVPGDTTDQQS